MATLTTQQIGVTGTAVTLAAAAGGGDAVLGDDRTFLVVNNASGGSITVTVVIPGTTYGQNNPDIPVAVPAAGTRYIGPLTAAMADPTTGLVGLTYSGVTSLTVGAVRC